MKKEFKNYFVGLDIGTDSVGWAVTDNEYNVQKFKGKSMWGVRLFEGGNTAEDRRMHRSATRRNNRKVKRIKLLQELFSEEISKVDMAFFQRLNDSKYLIQDKADYQKNTLFNDSDYDDKHYHEDYPTIYHLRKDLIENHEKHDIRLMYLAIHHIVKHRGHFLFEGKDLEAISDFEEVLKDLVIEINDEWDIELEYGSIEEIKTVLKSTSMGISDKKKKIQELIFSNKEGVNKNQIKAIAHVIIGAKVDLNALLDSESYIDENDKKISIDFKGSKYEEDYDDLSNLLNEKIYIVDKLKSIYDWSILENLLKGKKYLSEAKVEVYEKHKKDLNLLKVLVRKYFTKNKYKEVFSDASQKSNYAAYVGKTKSKNIKAKNPNKCGQDEFLKYIKKLFNAVKDKSDVELEYMINEIDAGTFMPKQVSKENVVLPYQVHLAELEVILDNAAKYYQFLLEKDDTGFTPLEKILKIFKFRIPYYVGPLNDAHKNKNIEKGHCWITKKSNEPIRPWNFEEVVDIDQCAEDFIVRMTNKCTYLIGADVLPKNSLLYSEFMVLNELNNLRIDGERVSQDIKEKIVDELFKKRKKVTQKALVNLLNINGYGTDYEISGIDGDFKSNLSSWIDFSKILGDKVNETEMVEDIIRWIVLFGDDKKMLKRRIENHFSKKLSNDEIKKILSLKYTGWGRLSREFLEDIKHVDKSTGEVWNIIRALRYDPYGRAPKNLMELLSREYDFSSNVEAFNTCSSDDVTEVSYKLVEDLYVSPAVKRSIWQSLRIIDEIVKITKKQPQKVFIEMAREHGDKKRTISRRNQLLGMYKSIKDEERDWIVELEKKEDSQLRSDRLYLYYTQMGRCMYSGEKIDLSRLYEKNLYDVDHIYPQSKIKDDSLENRVLVKKELNAEKGDEYPVPSSMRSNMNSYWKLLFNKKLIGKKKFERLTRNTPFSNNELADFIARQVVETRQSTKALAQVIKKIYDDTDIVYVKAGNVSRFRQHFDLIKVRDINDFHHAKDAFLNIVVGNVFDTKFTRNPYNFINNGERYTLNEKVLYKYDVCRNGYYAWREGDTIHNVKKTMMRNNVLITRYTYEQKGQLFDLLPMRKGKGQMPLKLSDTKLSDISKYGGYNKITGAYFTLVEHTEKGKVVRSIEPVPIYLSETIKKDNTAFMDYLENGLGLKKCKVLLPRIKMNSLFKVDGFPMNVTGRGGKQLVFKHAVSLVIGYDKEQYLKKVLKYSERVQQAKKYKRDIEEPTEYDGISRKENLEIYDTFMKKIKHSLYSKRFNAQIDKFQKGREIFEGELTVNQQCELLGEALHLFQCNRVLSDLSLIGGAKKAGAIYLNKTLSNGTDENEISIINQSPTGLFETEIKFSEL